MIKDQIAEFLGENKTRLILEVSYECNSACFACCVDSDSSKKNQRMDPQIARATIDQAKDNGINYLLITGGESTLVPYVPDLVEYANKKDIKTRINTNGSKSDINYWKGLRERGLDYACVSIDASHILPEINSSPIPIEKSWETVENLVNQGIGTIVAGMRFPGFHLDEDQIFQELVKRFRSFKRTKTGDEVVRVIKEGESVVKLIKKGKEHYLVRGGLINYDGRLQQVGFPLGEKCGLGVDLYSRFSIRMDPNHGIRSPCSSYQQIKIHPFQFDPSDSNSLMQGIKRLRKDEEFKKFLKQGLPESGVVDVCEVCIERFLK